MLGAKNFEKKFLDAEDKEERDRYLTLRSLLEKIARDLGGKVIPVIKRVENKNFLDYAIVQTFHHLWNITLLRAYITHGWTGESGSWSEITIAFRKKVPLAALKSLTKEILNVYRVNLNDYKAEKRLGFHPQL